MISRLKDWLKRERKNRIEEGTSQDMCPTNGDVISLVFGCSIGWIILLIGYLISR